MTITVNLASLESGTIFTFRSLEWKRGYSSFNGTISCSPKYGGQFQPKLAENLPANTEVTVSSSESL